MKTKMKVFAGAVAAIVLAGGISGWMSFKKNSNVPEMEEVEKVKLVGPTFNADSAYAYCEAQCTFGPRVMNSVAHDKCADWIIGRFRQYGCSVESQKVDLTGYDGTTLKANNIIASYRPEATTRILLCAHWDSRPWADNDPDSANWHKPVMAANDGASGIAVMLEVARLLQSSVQEPLRQDLGLDFVCFDAEDWGTPRWSESLEEGDTWALGAQYWSQNLPQGYEARYGILLDMVGGQGARFYQESMSLQYAPEIVRKVWRAARQADYGNYFPRREGAMITDDHIPVNKYANIPTIDIIPFYPDCEQSTFGPTWHTVNDDMAHIDKQTLKAVGQTIIQVLFTEE